MPDDQIETLRGLALSRVLEARGFPVTDSVRQQRADWTRQLHTQRSHYEPVWISGPLRLRREQKPAFLVDGELTIRSSYAIDDAMIVAAEANKPLP